MRLFKAGCIVLILTCFFHLLGHFSDSPPSNDTERQMLDLMENYIIPGAGTSMMSIFKGLSLIFSLWCLFSGTAGLLLIGKLSGADRRMFAWIQTGQAAIATGISVVYFFLPPIVCVATAFVLLAAGLATMYKEPKSA